MPETFRPTPSRARFLRPVALLALLLVPLACGPGSGGAGSGARPRSVLLITLDTTRADALSGDPASQALAPRIAALSHNGVRFVRTYTVTPLTLPAHASILTGLVPPRHGVRDNGHGALPPAASTLPELLQARGFDTAAFVSSVVLDRGFGLDQGFALYDQPELAGEKHGHRTAMRPAAETARRAAQWLTSHGQDPFFLWAHFYDAHAPYTPAPEHLERARGDAYRGEIAALDDSVGLLLDALAAADLTDETLVVVTSDHGESLGEHGESTHGALCYEGTMRVPLLFHFPFTPPAPGPQRLVSLVDLHPTLLALLGLEVPPGLDGIDLFAPDAPRERGVYFESYTGYLHFGWSPLTGWLDARGKYLHSSSPELYLSLQDPHELRNLAASRPRDCEAALNHIAELHARPALLTNEAATSAALSNAMSALGYARGGDWGTLPSPLEPTTRPAPGTSKHELDLLNRAQAFLDAGHPDKCRPLAEQILRTNPQHPMAMDYLALCQMHAGEFAKAATLLTKRLTLGEAADARLNLGLCHLELGNPTRALQEIEAARSLVPDSPEVLAAHQRVLEELER